MIGNFMKKKTRTTLIMAALVAVLSCAGLVAPRAMAADDNLKCSVLGPICNNVSTDTKKSDSKDSKQDEKNSPIIQLLNMVLGILTGLVGIAAVGAFVYAGIMYASASGKADQVAKAKTIMINAVIGILAFAVMRAALEWLIPGGLF